MKLTDTYWTIEGDHLVQRRKYGSLFLEHEIISSDPYVFVWHNFERNMFFCGMHNGAYGLQNIGGNAVMQLHIRENPSAFDRVLVKFYPSNMRALQERDKILKRFNAGSNERWYNLSPATVPTRSRVGANSKTRNPIDTHSIETVAEFDDGLIKVRL